MLPAAVFVRFLERLIKASADGRTDKFNDQSEQQALAHVTSHGALDDWLLVWENLRRLFARADAVALDKRQVILSSFNQLKSVSAGMVKPLAF